MRAGWIQVPVYRHNSRDSMPGISRYLLHRRLKARTAQSSIDSSEGAAMTTQDIKLLFAYNSWATNRYFDALESIPKETLVRDTQASHKSLQGTLAHLVGAEKIWLSRWVGKPETKGLSKADAPTLRSLKEIWEDVSARIARFISRLDDAKLQSSFEYANLKGTMYTNTLQQTLQHVVNHSSYHRGQLAVLMRQLGLQPVNTDLIQFYRLTAQSTQESS